MEFCRASFVLVFAISAGCADGDEREPSSSSVTITTTSTSADAGTDSGCTPGTEGCECIEGGQCVSGLVCASGLCVDVGGTGGGDETGEKPNTTANDDTTTGMPTGSCEGNCGDSVPEGNCSCTPTCDFSSICCPDYEQACPGACFFNADCDSDEVCSVSAQECVQAYGHGYQVAVTRFEDNWPDCWDPIDCLADVYFRVFYGNQGEVHESSLKNDVVVASWANDQFDMTIDSSKVFQIVFYDFDTGSADDPMHSVCLKDDQDACGPIGVEFLHAGGVVWDSTYFYVEITFVPK